MDSGGYYVEIACPACGGVIEVDAAGVDVTCPHCGAVLHRRPRKPVDAAASGVVAAALAAPAPVAPPAPEPPGAAPQATREAPAPASAPQEPPAARRNPEADEQGRVPVRDSRGRELLRAVMPEGWRYVAGTHTSLASENCPFAVRVEMREGDKVIRYHSFGTFPIRHGSEISEIPDCELPADLPFYRPSAWMDAKAAGAVGPDASTLVFEKSLDFSEANAKMTAELRKGFEEEIERSNTQMRQMAFGSVGVQSHISGCCHHTITRLYRFERQGRPARSACGARGGFARDGVVRRDARHRTAACGGTCAHAF